MTRAQFYLSHFLLFAFLFGCKSSEGPVDQSKQPRPVTALVLAQTDPREFTQLAGSVAAWKTEGIGFQVAGRVASILEPGVDIEGQTVDENNQPLTQGTVIGLLETRRYEVQLASARARERTAIAQAKATGFELDNVIPQQIKVAEAEVTLAKQEFARISQLFERKAVSKSEYDRTNAKLETAQAQLEQTLATKEVKRAELDSMQAQVAEAKEAVNEAQKNLDDTQLISPFRGQIAEVHEIPGGYVQAGEPVVTVQMMDPIKVDVVVSAKMDQRLNFSDVVNVYPPDSDEPVPGFVYEKATIADAATRTFTVTLLVRNEKVKIGKPDGKSGKKAVRVRNMWGLFPEKIGVSGPYFVNVESLHQDKTGYFVWKVEGLSKQSKIRDVSAEHTVRKIRVVPGEKRIPFLQVATLRKLVDHGELQPQQDVVAGALRDAEGKKLDKLQAAEALKDGGTVRLVRERWWLRPGDIVRVDLEGGQLQRGFYVPMDTIAQVADKSYVFVIDDEKRSRVKRVEVNVDKHENLDTYLRIESVESGRIADGVRIVAGGVHYLVDGEEVTVAREIEEQP